MPFGMGPMGWFYLPYFASYFPYFSGYPFYSGFPFFSKEQELFFLKSQERFLQDQLNWIEARIRELERKS